MSACRVAHAPPGGAGAGRGRRAQSRVTRMSLTTLTFGHVPSGRPTSSLGRLGGRRTGQRHRVADELRAEPRNGHCRAEEPTEPRELRRLDPGCHRQAVDHARARQRQLDRLEQGRLHVHVGKLAREGEAVAAAQDRERREARPARWRRVRSSRVRHRRPLIAGPDGTVSAPTSATSARRGRRPSSNRQGAKADQGEQHRYRYSANIQPRPGLRRYNLDSVRRR